MQGTREDSYERLRRDAGKRGAEINTDLSKRHPKETLQQFIDREKSTLVNNPWMLERAENRVLDKRDNSHLVGSVLKNYKDNLSDWKPRPKTKLDRSGKL